MHNHIHRHNDSSPKGISLIHIKYGYPISQECYINIWMVANANDTGDRVVYSSDKYQKNKEKIISG